jgi:hypothetical protein
MKRFSLTMTVVALSATVAIAAGRAQQGKPDQKPDTASVNVAGKWTMTMEMSMGTATPSLDLKQDGTTITGTYTGRYGTFALEGTLKDRVIQFTFQMGAEGETVTMSFSGEVAADAQTMKGTASLGEMGDATWSAKKEK